MHQFNRTFRNHGEKILNFPGASSNKILHYIDVHLKGKLNDTVIVHVGVNGLLNGNSQLTYYLKILRKLPQNLSILE